MSAFATPPSSSPPLAGSPALRFGTAVGIGAAAALASTLPATMRVAAATEAEGPLQVWLALAAAALAPMIGAILVLRGARDGLRAYAGGPDAELRAYGVALWLASLLVSLSVFGSVLRATTHQHALAGVTFAFGALALAIASALVCARIVTILSHASTGVRRTLGSLLALIALAALGWVALRFLRALSHDPASAVAGGTVVDVLAFVLAAVLGAQPSLAPRRALALGGPPIAVVVALLGATTLRDPPLREAIDQHAPAFAPTADLIPGP